MNAHEQVSRYAPGEVARVEPDGELEHWEIDPAVSHLDFTLRHLVVQEIHGQFRRWGGTLFLDRAEPWLSTVDVWVELASIDTNSVERDTHLRSAEFLNVALFPRAEFKSTTVEPHDGGLVLRGRLQLHGVTHDLDLSVELGAGGNQAVRNVYSVRSRVDRQLFGLHWNQDLDVGGVVVGDEIKLSAEVHVVHQENESTGEPASGRS
jgi:polyisoprenoid-binding protein YceI